MANTFTPEQITQILEEFFKVVGTRRYVGERYVPIFGRKGEESIEWDNSAPYEPLTIVLYQGNSYTSRQYVPIGVDITNQEFWVITGNYNAQVEAYYRETVAAREIADNAITTANNAQNDIDTLLPKADFSAENTVKKYIDESPTRFPTMSTTTKGIAKVGAGLAMNGDALELDGNGDIATAVTSWLNAHPEATTTVQDGSVTTAKLADGAVTITKLNDESNALKEVFAGLHIEKSQSYSSNYTYNVDVYVPKGAVCSITNNSDTNSNIGVHYNGVPTQFGTGFPTGTTFRFVAADTITRVWQYTTGGTLNAFTFDVHPMWLGDEVESLEQRFMPENLFNPDAEGVQSGWIHTDTGAITASGSWSTSDYIPIEVGKTYSHPAAVSLYGAAGAKKVPCFDAEKNWVGYFRGTIDANNVLTFTVPSRLSDGTGGVYRYDHVYARFTYSNANKNKVMFVEGAQPSEYVAYGASKLATNFGLNQKQKDEVVGLIGDSASPLYGKKIAYNGDSICESRLNTSSLAYNGGAYAKIISDITGCTYENRAHSGGILASATGDGTTAARYVVSDVENMASDADIICFEGGINDYWTKVPLGTYSESDYTGTLDTATICGALESIFRQATAKWVGKPICFVIVHKITSTVYTQNTQGYTFKDVHDMMLGICKKYAIPVFDAFEESGLNAYNSIQNTNFLTANANGTPDGCHPNEAGYRAFYVPQLIALFESLIARS